MGIKFDHSFKFKGASAVKNEKVNTTGGTF